MLIVPVKVRVNGTLETVQQKVISYETHCTLKEELKDAKEAADVLKQKVSRIYHTYQEKIKINDTKIRNQTNLILNF